MAENVSMIGYTRVSKADGRQSMICSSMRSSPLALIPSGFIRTASRVPGIAGWGWMHASPRWPPGTRW